ncbi:ABC transporter substrate-binding protein (plasmid) [Cereibacter azotoformans]|uniref:ABC transporter substrate-binding protein n=1 Tax=Cereibacter azotoformans TaxID=43057 RepID=UPI003B222CA3
MLRRMTLAACLVTLCPLPALARDGIFDIAAPFEIKGPDPSLSGDIFLKMDLAETLVNADAEGRLLPGLSDRWDLSDDRLSWRFHIRPGVRFHDGTLLTAEAAAQALRIARSREGLLAKAPIAAIAAEGDEVVISLTEPFAALPAFLAECRSQILAPAAYGPDGQATTVIGTGAFRVTRFEAPSTIEAERFEDYWGGKVALDRVTYRAVGRAETRALMAESGDADLVINLDPASVTHLRRVEQVEVLSIPLPRVLLLKLNAGHPFFDTAEERLALSQAIDRAGLAQAVLRYPAAADQMFPPSMPGWHVEGLAPLAHDPDAARAALAAQGWQPGPDGVLEKDGQRFEVELVTYPDRPELPLTAAVLQQMFAEIGVAATIVSTNSSEIPARHGAGTLQMGLFARNFALVPDPVGTLMQDYAPGGDWGAMGWDNPGFTATVQALARGEGGDAERARLVATLQAELPVLPIAWYQQTAAVARGVTGAVLDPYERSFGLKTMAFSQ